MAKGVERTAHLLGGIAQKLIALPLHRLAARRVRPAAKALGNEAARVRCPGRRQQMVGTDRPQLVGRGKGAVEMLEIRGPGGLQGGHLMDDHLGPGNQHGGTDRGLIERVGDNRSGAEAGDKLGVFGRWVSPMTICPPRISSRTSREPTAPVAPATKIRME